MKKFKVLYELDGRKFFSEVAAETAMQAQMRVLNKINFIEIQEMEPLPKRDPQLQNSFMGAIALGLLCSERTRIQMKLDDLLKIPYDDQRFLFIYIREAKQKIQNLTAEIEELQKNNPSIKMFKANMQ
jgi:hypothetical protein